VHSSGAAYRAVRDFMNTADHHTLTSPMIHALLQVAVAAGFLRGGAAPNADSAVIAAVARPVVPSAARIDLGIAARDPRQAFGVRAASADTVRRRPVAIEYSNAYATRASIHKWASYAIVPLFAAQYITGHELIEDQEHNDGGNARGGEDDEGDSGLHSTLAAGVGVLFGVNTVTGVWNLVEARKDPNGRGRRLTHGVLMLLADAGFVATGVLANSAGGSESKANLHKNVAIGSGLVALTSYAIMLPPFRRD
jgi:hypothetical protein